MKDIDKQWTGFRFGKHRLEVLEEWGSLRHNGRIYKVVRVKTHMGLEYISLRLYNSSGKFIKQFLMEPEVVKKVCHLLLRGE